MSVLIKGMEMPTSCESCPCKTADAFGGLGCQATGYIPLRKANQDRPDNCPLVPVPEPHGKLIDADAVTLTGGPHEFDEWCKFALERYLDAPTVIPASEEG